MSIPLSYCMFPAALDDAEKLARLRKAMAYNLKCGHFQIRPCSCNPQCRELTDEEKTKLTELLAVEESEDTENKE